VIEGIRDIDITSRIDVHAKGQVKRQISCGDAFTLLFSATRDGCDRTGFLSIQSQRDLADKKRQDE
jgi:hypothetical protein